MRKNISFAASDEKKGNKSKTKNINIKPIYEVAKFTPIRTPINPAKKFQISMLDLFPMGIKLTGNETKVLFVLRSVALGNSNLAAIDQEQISLLTLLERGNVAHAIAGLRKKGLIKQTWMEEGSQRYRNIYALWSPPKQVEQDAKKMLSQQKRVKKMESQAKNSDPKFRKKIELEKAKICISCGGKGWHLVYVPSKDKEVGRLCVCPLANHLATLHSLSFNEFIPEEILKELLKTS